VIGSSAVTTGLFVLAGVVVGGLVTGGVTYALELRREGASARVALRLLEIELAIAGSVADEVLEKQSWWAAWKFERAHRAWNEYRAEAARVLSVDEWVKVSIGFYGVDAAERAFAEVPSGTNLDPPGLKLVEEVRRSLYDGSNTLRRHMGMDEIGPGGELNA
jgi:hypothetical protein